MPAGTSAAPQSAGRLHLPRLAVWLRRLRARLRNRPDSEHELTINRLVLSGLTLLYLVLASSLGYASATAMLDKAGGLISLYYTTSLALFGWILLHPGASAPRRMIGMVNDFGIFSYCMHVGGEAMAPLYPIYLWVIFGNGFRFGLTYLALASACGVLSFAAVVLTTPFWHEHIGLSAGLTAGLVLLPLYVSSLIRKLSEARQQAEAASRAKSLFLASVSHELRTPLNAIIGLSELMRAGKLDAEQADMVHTIGQSGRTLLGHINAILDFTRLEAGQMPVRTERFELAGLLGGVKRMLAVQAAGKGLDLALHVSPRTPSALSGDRVALEQILLNLAANAVKFTSAGYVVFAADAIGRNGDMVRLRFEVSDSGIGIAKEAQQRIFETFTQANETIIDRFGGTGLGLAIVKQLVERQGGAVGVESEPGRGSTFWFELEMQAAVAEARPQPHRIVLLTQDAALEARLRAILPDLHCVSEPAAAEALLAPAEEASAAPLAIIDASTVAATAWAERLGASGTAPPALILLTAAEEPGLLPLPERRLFASAVPRQGAGEWITAALAFADAPPSAGTEPAPLAPQSEPQGRLAILVAEDNRTNQKVIRKILERAGHDVDIVEDGEAALDALAARAYDLVLMDINMPVLNGVEATKLYRFGALGERRLPIIALTADATEAVRTRCAEAGFDECLTKPVEPLRLLETIRRFGGPGRSAAQASATETSPVTAPAGATDAIEEGKIEELIRLGGPDFVDELVQQFIADATETVTELAAAVRRQDVTSFRELAHALRSSAANLGAERMHALCLSWREIDAARLAQQGETQVAALAQEFERVRAALSPRRAA